MPLCVLSPYILTAPDLIRDSSESEVRNADRRFLLVWMKEDGNGSEELLQMNPKPGWVGMKWVVTLHRFLTQIPFTNW